MDPRHAGLAPLAGLPNQHGHVHVVRLASLPLDTLVAIVSETLQDLSTPSPGCARRRRLITLARTPEQRAAVHALHCDPPARTAERARVAMVMLAAGWAPALRGSLSTGATLRRRCARCGSDLWRAVRTPSVDDAPDRPTRSPAVDALAHPAPGRFICEEPNSLAEPPTRKCGPETTPAGRRLPVAPGVHSYRLLSDTVE